MYLRLLHIRNFRGIKDLTINFNPKLNVVIGSNGSSKTAVIDAIRLFYSLNDRDNGFDVENEDFYQEMVDDDHGGKTLRQSDKIEIDYVFDGMTPGQQGSYSNFLSAEGEPSTMVARVNLTFTIDENDRVVKHCTPGNPDAGHKLDYDSLSLFNCYYLRAVRDSTKDLLSTRYNILGQVIKRKLKKNNTEESIRTIIDGANNCLLEQNEVIETKFGLNDNLDLILNRNDYHVDLRIDQSRIDYIVNVIKPYLPEGINNEGPLNLKENSLGYNNLIYIATVLSDIKDHQTYDADSVYALLIEEPEAHLHPQLQVNLYNFLKKADASLNSQLFITSHSPTLTSRIPLENLIVLNNKAYNVVNCFKDRLKESIIDNTREKTSLTANRIEELRNMLQRYLDVTRSQMLYAKGCIFIEGISESQLLETFSCLVNKSLSDNQIEIVNADSTAFHQFLMLYNSCDENKRLPQKVSFITDGDQYTDSKNVSLDKLIEDYSNISSLRNNIKKDKGNSRISNLLSLRNRRPNILICTGYKTLEYQICRANVDDTIRETKNKSLYKFLENKYSRQVDKIQPYLSSFKDKYLTHDEKMDVAIVLWKCITHKSTFAQDLSYYLDNLKKVEQPVSFVVPKYIMNAIIHVVK